jgi:hypothetical protein
MPHSSKNNGFGGLVQNLPHDFSPKHMGFEPPNVILLHLFGSKKRKTLIWIGF